MRMDRGVQGCWNLVQLCWFHDSELCPWLLWRQTQSATFTQRVDFHMSVREDWTNLVLYPGLLSLLGSAFPKRDQLLNTGTILSVLTVKWLKCCQCMQHARHYIKLSLDHLHSVLKQHALGHNASPRETQTSCDPSY